MYKRTVLLTAFSSLILAAPALAAPGHHQKAADAPCDADGPLDNVYDPVAFFPDRNYFPDDEQALPDGDEQAAPDADDDGDSADDPDADGDEDAAPDGEGCAQIMVAPYDIMIRPPDQATMPVVLRRRVAVRWGDRT
jgi:hypothetical protein